MGRSKIYANDAARQRACRARRATLPPPEPAVVPPSPSPPPPPRRRHPSRPLRLQALVTALRLLYDEYEGWWGNVPPSLAASGLAERLEETVEQFEAALDILEGLTLPKGYGRD